MSPTRRFMKALVRFGSDGVVRVTVGLSSVGPPPSLRINHVFASFMITGSRSSTTWAPKTPLVEVAGSILVGNHQELRDHETVALRCREIFGVHIQPP